MEEINENIQEQEVQHEENLEFIADAPKEENPSTDAAVATHR